MTTFIVAQNICLALSGYSGGKHFTKDPGGNSMYVPLKRLKKVPLMKKYLWPDAFLIITFALGASIATIVTAYDYSWWQEFNRGPGVVLMSWIVIELIFISKKSPIQYVYFILGFLFITLPLL